MLQNKVHNGDLIEMGNSVNNGKIHITGWLNHIFLNDFCFMESFSLNSILGIRSYGIVHTVRYNDLLWHKNGTVCSFNKYLLHTYQVPDCFQCWRVQSCLRQIKPLSSWSL